MERLLLREIRAFVVLSIVAILCINMGDKKMNSAAEAPTFAKLAEGEGSFRAIVYDHQNQYLIRDISFFGSTMVGGIRRESDDSVTRLEFSKIRDLTVLQAHYDSKHFGDKEFLLAEVKTVNGAVTSDLLIPGKVVICGIDEKTGLEKSWFLEKINKITIQGRAPLPMMALVPVEQVSEQAAQPVVPNVVPEPIKELLPAAMKPEAQGAVAAQPAAAQAPIVVYEHPKQEQTPTELVKHQPGMWGAFLGILDAIIDFFKAIVLAVTKLFGG